MVAVRDGLTKLRRRLCIRFLDAPAEHSDARFIQRRRKTAKEDGYASIHDGVWVGKILLLSPPHSSNRVVSYIAWLVHSTAFWTFLSCWFIFAA